MKSIKSLAEQKGALLLLVIVVTGLTALTGALATRVVIQNQEATNRVYDDLIEGRPISDERMEQARLSTLNNLRVMNGAANIIVSIDPNPDGGSVVSSYAGGVINNHVDQASNPNPATSNNLLPSDIMPPRPSCDSANHGLCSTYARCRRAEGHWHNGACYSTPQTSCDSNHLDFCSTSSECGSAGGFWYDGKCNASPSACYVDVTQCANSTDCSNALGYWYNDQCNLDVQLCSSDDVTQCPDNDSCGQAGGYWYSNGCNAAPDQYVCRNGSVILRELVCNGTENCPGGDDEANCGTEASCCVATNGCPSETATSCGETCCCCPYGYICDQQNPANGCVPSS